MPAPTPELDAAMDAFAAGDAAAFATVDTLARPILVRVLRRLTRDRAAADDLAQETLIRVLRAPDRWRPGARFLPWAYAIARRRFLDRIRHLRVQGRVHDAIVHREALRGPAEAPDAALAGRHLAARITVAFAALPPAQRDVVQRIVVDGDSVAATAHRLGEARTAVRVRLHRARRALAASVAA